MSGQLLEFPRKLEWKCVACWYGRVAGTSLYAKVEESLDGNGYNWFAWNGPVTLGSGKQCSMELAQGEAKKVMEASIVIIRPLPVKAGI